MVASNFNSIARFVLVRVADFPVPPLARGLFVSQQQWRCPLSHNCQSSGDCFDRVFCLFDHALHERPEEFHLLVCGLLEHFLTELVHSYLIDFLKRLGFVLPNLLLVQ